MPSEPDTVKLADVSDFSHREAAPWPKSVFATNLTRHNGTLELMEDLGEAMTTGRGETLMMGGGNPGHIPEMQAIWRKRMHDLMADEPAFDSMLADYEPPAGNPHFRLAVAALLNREFGWPVTEHNICVTNGGQTAFFFLLNRFAGEFPDGSRRRLRRKRQVVGRSEASAFLRRFSSRVSRTIR